MKEETARGLAFAIIGHFEQLLAEHDIMIPSADREGREEEACIYGTEYYLLEDAITDILVSDKLAAGKTVRARDRAFRILEEFEEMLDRHQIKVPSAGSAPATGRSALCVTKRDRLRDGIVKLLRREAALHHQPGNSQVYKPGSLPCLR